MPLVYDELRGLAERLLRNERPGHTLQPTALVHEAYLRLIDQTRVRWQGRAHFFALASCTIRRILVDHARGARRVKRGGGRLRLSLNEDLVPTEDGQLDLIALDDALSTLAADHPDQARIVEMRFFGGLTIAETATVLGVSASTVEREWRFARAWLYRALTDAEQDAPDEPT
jgi:RNA polymerase sigma factor (TIGR02999 family)